MDITNNKPKVEGLQVVIVRRWRVQNRVRTGKFFFFKEAIIERLLSAMAVRKIVRFRDSRKETFIGFIAITIRYHGEEL